MNLFDASMSDLIGAFLGFIFTLLIFSYAWGDNPFFKIATHIFIGAAAGYVTIITINSVVLPHLISPLLSGNRSEMILAVIYLIPCAMILTKVSPILSKVGNPAMAILVGIGAAAAVGGAVTGTVFPQVTASINDYENPKIINAAIILIGTLSTLIYFHFGVEKDSGKGINSGQILQGIGWVGQAFIAITFSAIFAGVYFAALTALIERITYIWEFIRSFLEPVIGG